MKYEGSHINIHQHNFAVSDDDIKWEKFSSQNKDENKFTSQ